MSRSEQVHWHEGLFLQPHHLQAMQRFLLDQTSTTRSLVSPYPYGVISYDLSVEAIKNNRVQFEHLHVIMRSGLEVIYPGNADLDPLEIGGSLGGSGEGLIIELAVPFWRSDGVNVVSMESNNGWGSRYRLREVQQLDENTGTNPQPLVIRRLNARLVPAGDRRGGVETLPILRVKNDPTDGRPVVDPNFIAPCVTMGGSSELGRILGAIFEQVLSARDETQKRLRRQEFNAGALAGAQLYEVFRLRILSRFAATLAAIVGVRGVTPLLVYMELAALLGELSSLNPERDELFSVPPYNHDNLALCFHELAELINPIVGGPPPTTVAYAEFAAHGQILATVLKDEHWKNPDRCYLSFTDAGSPDALGALVQDKDRFKLMARAEVVRPIRGVTLEPVWSAPSDLPTGPLYFKLDLSDPYSKQRWANLFAPANQNIAAIVCPAGKLPPTAKVKLCMPLATKASS